jgi:hypothetical protein
MTRDIKTAVPAADGSRLAAAAGWSAYASGVPLASWRNRIVCAALIFVPSLGVYFATMAPTVTLVDSGELTVAARYLGVAHAPGFPLYVLLAHLVSIIPIGTIAQRVNFASGLFAAVASSLVGLVVAEGLLIPARKQQPTTRAERRRNRTKKKSRISLWLSEPSPSFPLPYAAALFPAVLCGLMMSFSRTLWAYATIAEVYTLNALLISLIILLMVHWRSRAVAFRNAEGARLSVPDSLSNTPGPSTPATVRGLDLPLYVAALVFGLALGVHHVTVALMLPGLAAFVLITEGLSFFRSKRLLYSALISVGGLGVYAYLPLAASHSGVMNWGNPTSLQRIWWHISAKQYQVFLTRGDLDKLLDQFLMFAGREFGPVWMPIALVLVLAGFVALFQRDKAVFSLLALMILADVAYGSSYEIAEDKDAYYLPTFIACAIAAGYGASWLIRLAASTANAPSPGAPAALAPIALAPKLSSVAKHVALVCVALLLVPAVTLASNLHFNNRSRYFIAHDYVDNIMSTIQPEGMVLTLDWQVYSPMLYVRHVEQRRRDLVAVDVNLLRRSWYYDYIEREYPALINETRDKVDAFLEDLRAWDLDPDAYQTKISLNRRISSRFNDMILAFVATQMQRSAVYVTIDIARGDDGQNGELTKLLAASYQLVPQGLVFQLARDREYHEPAQVQLVTRGLNDGTLYFEDDDVVKLKVLPVYLNMLLNTGRYLSAHGRYEPAAAALDEALKLDRGFQPAQQQRSDLNRYLLTPAR